jgi:endonuclease YncB( thermonuclease family)
MFRLLHKVYLGFCWLAVIAVAGLMYYHRSVCYPLVDLVDALRVREGLEQQKSGEMSGKVARVLSGDMFILRDERGRACTIRLTGVEAPSYELNNRAAQLRALASKTNLSRLVLSNNVRVELTCTNDSRCALGIVYVGTNNINVQAVETGIVQAKRENMRGLPLKDRYALIQAKRRARTNTE